LRTNQCNGVETGCVDWQPYLRPSVAEAIPGNCKFREAESIMLISELMAKELVTETAMTRSLLSNIPDDKLNWQPPRELHSIGWNASHLVEIVGWVPGILEQIEWDIAPEGQQPYEAPVATQTSQLLEMFDDHCNKALRALQGVPDSVMDELWSLKMGGQILFTMQKGDCLRKWVFSHTAHHRGILSVYLRMAGVQVRSVYEE
jgi:uncharacterized damage-inducible protein DinB